MLVDGCPRPVDSSDGSLNMEKGLGSQQECTFPGLPYPIGIVYTYAIIGEVQLEKGIVRGV
jgi:hypothetical protein